MIDIKLNLEIQKIYVVVIANSHGDIYLYCDIEVNGVII